MKTAKVALLLAISAQIARLNYLGDSPRRFSLEFMGNSTIMGDKGHKQDNRMAVF